MCSDLLVALELCGKNAVSEFRKKMGPSQPSIAKIENPQTLRAIYGKNHSKNAVHGSNSKESATRELQFFFHYNSQLKSPAMLKYSSLCLIKPHILKEKKVGEILNCILAQGFEISSL